MPRPFKDKALDILQDFCDTRFNGNVRAMAVSLGMDPDAGMLHRWLKKRNPTLAAIGPCLDQIGVVLLGPDEVQRSPDSNKACDPAIMKELEEVRKERDQLLAQNYVLQGRLEAYKSMVEEIVIKGGPERQPATITQSGKGNKLNALNNNQ